MGDLATAIALAKAELGLDDDDFDSIGYQALPGNIWVISFSLNGVPVGTSAVEVG